jgi:signal transduction histidine kinase
MSDPLRRLAFLGDASAALAESLDFARTLRTVAAVAVPSIADWCGIEIVPEDGGPSVQLAVAHVDPEKVAYAEELRRRYPPAPDVPTGVPAVLRTGRAELYPVISDELLAASVRDPDQLRIARELGLHSAMIVPMRAHGRTVGAITFVTADTPPREYDDDDLAMAQDLADRAALAIANARLYEAERRAVALRDEFLSIAGHELRTPLTALRLQVESIGRVAREGSPERLIERANRSLAVVERLTRLVDELLDVSRISGGRLALDRDVVDLGQLVQEVATRLTEAARGLDLRLDLADGVEGRWDRHRLEQVVTNLMTNALKYGEERPIEVRVARDGDRAVLAVTDHGIGIAAEDQARIFERFERAAAPRTVKGLGLGLWIAREVVHAHGGTIAVTSEPGRGSTFTVTLPV